MIFLFISMALLLLAWCICGLIAFKLWLEWRSLCRTYDVMEDTVDKINHLLNEEERKIFEDMFKEIDKHLRER